MTLAEKWLRENNLMGQFKGLMMDGMFCQLHSDRWSMVYDWVKDLGFSKTELPDAIETELTEFWERSMR